MQGAASPCVEGIDGLFACRGTVTGCNATSRLVPAEVAAEPTDYLRETEDRSCWRRLAVVGQEPFMNSSVAVSVMGRKYLEVFGASPTPSFNDYVAAGREPDRLAALGYR